MGNYNITDKSDFPDSSSTQNSIKVLSVHNFEFIEVLWYRTYGKVLESEVQKKQRLFALKVM
ncbi:unnamed protein product (macronuclear) [Paramecium tetraurelia]|uniref:Protein kinase domain-containing protein n=1 Tax=Paramecium tetraurelia TaxID=5888 RepID=A0BME5_PARTE|nr:uncharacterized protein GSPATT00030348001 [Paramecium tetraurelia]CAK59712.1 unnamed protein product [Paramecium tetraurelia]|eukprot:XP_001427110.1 hypothetical protein (macronuclear) [Paramecium tetraurelia strain d4-2]